MQWNIIFFQNFKTGGQLFEEYLIISKFSSQKFPFNSIFPLEPTVLVERTVFQFILGNKNYVGRIRWYILFQSTELYNRF